MLSCAHSGASQTHLEAPHLSVCLLSGALRHGFLKSHSQMSLLVTDRCERCDQFDFSFSKNNNNKTLWTEYC